MKFSLPSIASSAFVTRSILFRVSKAVRSAVSKTYCFGFFFFFPLSIFLFRLCCRKTFSLKLWVVNFIILAWFPFFAPPMGCILSTCFLKSFSSIPASFADITADITFNASPLFVSSFHFPRIYRSVLCKITIDPLYFWDVYDVNLWE